MNCVYVIQNVVNDKVYIGQTIHQANKRFKTHFSLLANNKHKNTHLQSAWNKYGKKSFTYYVLSTLSSQKELDEAENFYIGWFKQLDLCYNIALKARGTGLVSEESKKKMSESRQGKPLSESHKSNISTSLAGHSVSLETIEKIKRTMKIQGSFRHSKETKQKMSDTRKGKKRKPLTDDHKEKMRQARLGKKLPKHTEEANLRLGASKAKEFSFTKPDGEQVHFINLQKFCRDNNLQAGNMYRVFVGERKSHKGWTK